MSDPFDVLASPIEPQAPDPAFALRLRRRVETTLSLPRGVEPMTDATLTDTALTDTALTDTALTDASLAEPGPAATRPGPAVFPRPGVLPYITVDPAAAAIDWYVDVLGARLLGDPVQMPDGSIGHAELAVGDGVIYLAGPFPELDLVGPAGHGTAVSLLVPVEDTDGVLERARGAGARVVTEVYEGHGNRNAAFVDPFGHRWMLAGPVSAEAVAEPIRPGDVGYAAWWTPDVERAATFYAAVLGWEYAEHAPDAPGRRITNLSQPRGLWQDDAPETGPGTLLLGYAVEDLDAATQAVRDGGGQAQDPTAEERRVVARCADDQGLRFFLYHSVTGETRPAVNGVVPGDLSYITMEVRDAGRAQAFYGAVFGFDTRPGSVEDGWQIDEVRPMTGMAGGGSGRVVPMWKVTDVAAAVQRVRDAGGSAGDPDQRPYGIMADCRDDQGGRFYLGDA